MDTTRGNSDDLRASVEEHSIFINSLVGQRNMTILKSSGISLDDNYLVTEMAGFIEKIETDLELHNSKNKKCLRRDNNLNSLSFRSEISNKSYDYDSHSSSSMSIDSHTLSLSPFGSFLIPRIDSLSSEVFSSAIENSGINQLQNNPRNPIIIKRNANIDRMISQVKNGGTGNTFAKNSSSPTASPTSYTHPRVRHFHNTSNNSLHNSSISSIISHMSLSSTGSSCSDSKSDWINTSMTYIGNNEQQQQPSQLTTHCSGIGLINSSGYGELGFGSDSSKSTISVVQNSSNGNNNNHNNGSGGASHGNNHHLIALIPPSSSSVDTSPVTPSPSLFASITATMMTAAGNDNETTVPPAVTMSFTRLTASQLQDKQLQTCRTLREFAIAEYKQVVVTPILTTPHSSSQLQRQDSDSMRTKKS